MWFLRLAFLFCFGIAVSKAQAEVAEAEPREDDQFDFMNVLSDHGLHDLKDERWNLYGQITYISSWKSAFPALYTNLNGSTNSLSPRAEYSFTGTATFYLGLKPWHGAEIQLVPEIISERPLSNLTGLGGVIQNFELQKSGSEDPTLYLSRVYLKQTFGLGGTRIQQTSDPMQLGGVVDSRRLVLTVGNFSILDFLDKNSFSGDLRRQFLNMAFLTYAAYDFAADARGYAWGAVGEYYHDDWVLRFAHITPPKDPNQLPVDSRIFRYYGDQLELEHKHVIRGQPGAVRVLGYRNHEYMGRWDDAIAAYQTNHRRNSTTCTDFNYGSNNVSAPDLCWARKPNEKMGIGINFEQRLADDIGVFFRGMYSDGQTEVYSYTSTDRSISLGALIKGDRWGRGRDTLGVGYAQGWLSSKHAEYLNLGGIDGFLGDGRIHYRPEQVVDIFYSLNVLSSLWLSADYQHIANPGYNADRGPVDVYGLRAHLEF
ncbi:MAG: carbohydrate porin [Methylococcaceae bacterium]|nr:carbohydrate porin [Methylococcaceae bacterium]